MSIERLLDRLAREHDADDLRRALAKGMTEEEWHALRAAERDAAEARRASDMTRRAAAHREREEHEQAEATALGQRLGLGVPIRPVYAMRLSGLAARSDGTGTNRASVVHLYVLGTLTRGRLNRQSGQFLCDARLRPFDISLAPFDATITCPRCRPIAGL